MRGDARPEGNVRTMLENPRKMVGNTQNNQGHKKALNRAKGKKKV